MYTVQWMKRRREKEFGRKVGNGNSENLVPTPRLVTSISARCVRMVSSSSQHFRLYCSTCACVRASASRWLADEEETGEKRKNTEVKHTNTKQCVTRGMYRNSSRHRTRLARILGLTRDRKCRKQQRVGILNWL